MAKHLNHKKRRTFSLAAPNATFVTLAGDFTNWQINAIPMKKHPDGTWKVSVPLEPGEHRYRFLVDGAWQDDPACSVHAPNPFGSNDAVISVPDN